MHRLKIDTQKILKQIFKKCVTSKEGESKKNERAKERIEKLNGNHFWKEKEVIVTVFFWKFAHLMFDSFLEGQKAERNWWVCSGALTYRR